MKYSNKCFGQALKEVMKEYKRIVQLMGEDSPAMGAVMQILQAKQINRRVG